MTLPLPRTGGFVRPWDDYEFVVHPRLMGSWAPIVRGAIKSGRLEAREPAGVQLGGSGDAV